MTTDPNSPERIEAARRAAERFRLAVGRGETPGDDLPPAPQPDRTPLRKLKEPPADGRPR